MIDLMPRPETALISSTTTPKIVALVRAYSSESASGS
jgi:hypothetical protein